MARYPIIDIGLDRAIAQGANTGLGLLASRRAEQAQRWEAEDRARADREQGALASVLMGMGADVGGELVGPPEETPTLANFSNTLPAPVLMDEYRRRAEDAELNRSADSIVARIRAIDADSRLQTLTPDGRRRAEVVAEQQLDDLPPTLRQRVFMRLGGESGVGGGVLGASAPLRDPTAEALGTPEGVPANVALFMARERQAQEKAAAQLAADQQARGANAMLLGQQFGGGVQGVSVAGRLPERTQAALIAEQIRGDRPGTDPTANVRAMIDFRRQYADMYRASLLGQFKNADPQVIDGLVNDWILTGQRRDLPEVSISGQNRAPSLASDRVAQAARAEFEAINDEYKATLGNVALSAGIEGQARLQALKAQRDAAYRTYIAAIRGSESQPARAAQPAPAVAPVSVGPLSVTEDELAAEGAMMLPPDATDAEIEAFLSSRSR